MSIKTVQFLHYIRTMSDAIKKEYFELVNKLNSSNKIKNQNTEIYFYIDESDLSSAKLFAAISNTQKILLCEKVYDIGDWGPLYLSGFSNLEDFLVKILNKKKHETNLTEFIKSHIFKFE